MISSKEQNGKFTLKIDQTDGRCDKNDKIMYKIKSGKYKFVECEM